MAYTGTAFFEIQSFMTTNKFQFRISTNDLAKWKLQDKFDVWYTEAGIGTDSTLSYKQIQTNCKKVENFDSEDYIITSATSSRYLYYILVPKGAVEKGEIELVNDFEDEFKKAFNNSSITTSGGTKVTDIYPTTANSIGFSFGTTAKQPCLCLKVSTYLSSRNVSQGRIATYKDYQFVLAVNSSSKEPDFTEKGAPPKGSVTVTNNLENCVSNVADGTVVEDGEQFSITLTANPNFKFLETDPPTVFYDTTYGGTTRTMLISEDGKTAVATTNSEGLNNLIPDGVLTVTAKAYAEEVETPSATVTAQLSNCTAQNIPDSVTQGALYEIAFTPSEGFEFKVAPYAKYVDGSGSEHIIEGEFTAESATLAFNISDLGNGSEILIVAGAVEAEVQDFSCAVLNDLKNAVCEPSLSEIKNGTDVSLKLSPESTLYSFQDFDLTYLEYVDGNGETQKVYGYYDNFHSYRTITVNGISLQRGSVVTIHAVAYAGEASFDYSQIRHCTAKPVYTAYDKEFSQTAHQQLFIADDGYFFNGTVSFELTNNDGTTFHLNATYDADRTTASIEIPSNMNSLKPNSKIVANAVAVRLEKQYEISTTFLPTERQIFELSQKRYYTLSQSQGDYISLEQIDLGQYILSLRKMFFDLPSDDVQSIILGFYNTDIVCATFDGIKHSVSCGVVEVQGLYGNSLDFTNAKIEIALPFVGVKELDASKVMNRQIALYYDVNVTAGECVARLVDDETKQTLYAFNGFCAYDIPYILEYSLGKSYQIPEGDLSVGNLALFHCIPTITIRENDVVDNELSFGDNTALFTPLDNLSGYNEVDNVRLDGVSCTADEAQMIREVLRGGVYL